MHTGSFAIIQDTEGKFLISHRRDLDLWNLPGGAIEEMETPWDAVIREVYEETGLIVIVKQLQGVYYKAKTSDLTFSFLCTATGGELVPTNEADLHYYCKLTDIPKNFSPNQLDRLKDHIKYPNTVVLKTQDFMSSREYLAQLKDSM
jgi:8-oxo-dGTP diphosphatase